MANSMNIDCKNNIIGLDVKLAEEALRLITLRYRDAVDNEFDPACEGLQAGK
jgi:hypothetical protein